MTNDHFSGARRRLAPRPKRSLFERYAGLRVRLRIDLRIARMRLRLWRKSTPRKSLLMPWLLIPRPAQILIIASVIGYCLYRWMPRPPIEAALASLSVRQPGGPHLEWREVIQVGAIFLGLPIAFLLWMYRDQHVHATLENQRKDVTLKEFEEIQMRAAGALDESLPAQAREALQIAALHQLRGFLRGEYGESFRRPAFELLRARLEMSAEDTGSAAIARRIAKLQRLRNRIADMSPMYRCMIIRRHAEDMRARLGRLTIGPRRRAELLVVKEECRAFFRGRFPLPGSRLHQISLPAGAFLSRLPLSNVDLLGAFLEAAHLERASLDGAHLECAELNGAHLELADLSGAYLMGANLRSAHLEGADLHWADLQGADLHRAALKGADLGEANLEGADLRGADLSGANLQGANLGGVMLMGARFVGANLEGANLSAAALKGADLRGANLRFASLRGAGIGDARFEGANLANVVCDTDRIDNASYDDSTLFSDWSAVRFPADKAVWIERGMVHVRDRKRRLFEDAVHF